MATLRDTTVVNSITAANSTVWHAGNDGGGTALNVQFLWGFQITHLDIQDRTTALDLTSGSNTLFYPMLFSQSGWGSGIMEMSVRKGSVHQGGSGAGALYGRFRYRTTQWGHHGSFWEMEDNWGGGFNYPYIAGMNSNGQNNQSVMWLRGNTVYYYTWNNASDNFFDTTVSDSKTTTETSGAINTWTSRSDSFIPGDSRYLQKHVCGKSGFNLGDSSYRWGTVFAVAQNASSDARLKKDIGESLGSEFLRKLKPRSYVRISSYYTGEPDSPVQKYPEGGKRTAGFIAQEVKEVLDELGISEQQFGGYDGEDPSHLSLKYSEFIPVLVKSLQEKRERIQSIKKRIKRLKGEQ
jgi:hypothetical protein